VSEERWTVSVEQRAMMRCPLSGELCTSWTCLVDVCDNADPQSLLDAVAIVQRQINRAAEDLSMAQSTMQGLVMLAAADSAHKGEGTKE
jgi:hypothetical protein